VSPFPVKTTVPDGADTVDPGSQVPSWTLVLLWSASEPHRVGEVAFLPTFERRLVGRGDEEVEKFAHFGKQRPGEPFAPHSREGFLAGDGISRRQLLLRPTAVAVEMEQVGRCTTLVNGEEKTRASLRDGDTVLLRRQALLLCVRRPRTLAGHVGGHPPTPGLRALHTFGGPDAHGIVGESPAAWDLREQLARAATTDDHVLVRGESGTGKELAAAALHRGSKRANSPFVVHNASNFTISLLDSELYGNSANYPNPGMPARKGLFGSADRGTLFLDEVGDCPLEVQAHLLRVLDAGEYRPVGDATARRVDVRVIGATNRDDSFFRPDFRARFGRSVRMPPLRERREDIPLLIRHWLLRRARKYPELVSRFVRVGPSGGMEPKISARLVDHLVRQPLPLNVRELNAFLLSALEASPGDEVKLPLSNTTPPPEPPEKEEETEVRGAAAPSKEEIVACLAREGGNVSRVAKRLGLHRNIVYRLMREYGIKRADTAP
jgi:two-component system nitrogen regulation response regulator GlnG/two-component system response regulator HydG